MKKRFATRKVGRKIKRRYMRRKFRIVNKVPSGAAPLARKHIVKLKYSDIISMTTTSLGYTNYVFRMNSVYDPDVSSTGHQPYGFDQLAAIFNRYRVFKCSWHISVSPSNDRLHVCVLPTNNTVIGSSISAYSEQPYAVTKALGFNGGTQIPFKGSVYLPKIIGVTSVQYKTDDRFSADISTNPTESALLQITTYNPSPSTVTTSFNITLVYHTEFYDPFPLAQS